MWRHCNEMEKVNIRDVSLHVKRARVTSHSGPGGAIHNPCLWFVGKALRMTLFSKGLKMGFEFYIFVQNYEKKIGR